MTELISQLRNQSFPARLLVKGDPGSGECLRLFLPLMSSSVCMANYNLGKSVALVGYLLFYLITQGQRVILQSETLNGGLGYVFDDNGVHEVFKKDSWQYNDNKSCYLLVSADGTEVYPQD